MLKSLFVVIGAMFLFTGCFYHGYHNHHYGYYQTNENTDVIIIKEKVRPSCNLSSCSHHSVSSCSINHCNH